MVKRIALLVLLALLVGAAIWQRVYVRGITPRLTGALSEVTGALEQEDYERAVQKSEAFMHLWYKQKPTYEALFEHDEVDVITATGESVVSFCRSREAVHALADIEAILFHLEHIDLIDSVRWQNVF